MGRALCVCVRFFPLSKFFVVSFCSSSKRGKHFLLFPSHKMSHKLRNYLSVFVLCCCWLCCCVCCVLCCVVIFLALDFKLKNRKYPLAANTTAASSAIKHMKSNNLDSNVQLPIQFFEQQTMNNLGNECFQRKGRASMEAFPKFQEPQ